jgi:hypothetical protein
MRSFMICTPHRIYGTYGAEIHTGFWWGNLKEPLGRPRHRQEDNIKVDHKEKGWEGMDWIHLVQETEKWQALVNMVMNLQVSYKVGNFSLAEEVSASHKLCSM